MGDEVERRGRRVNLASRASALDAEQAPLVAESAGMREQVADRDRPAAEVGDFREVLPNVIVERELPVLREEDDRARRELLGARAALEHGGVRVGHAVLEVRRAIALRVERLSVLREAYPATRRLPVERGKDAID